MSDETSRAWPRTRCPSLPVANPPSQADPDADAIAASCKLIWGKSPAQVVQGLPTDEECGSSERKVTEELVRRPLPFTPLDVGTPAPLPSAPNARSRQP